MVPERPPDPRGASPWDSPGVSWESGGAHSGLLPTYAAAPVGTAACGRPVAHAGVVEWQETGWGRFRRGRGVTSIRHRPPLALRLTPSCTRSCTHGKRTALGKDPAGPPPAARFFRRFCREGITHGLRGGRGEWSRHGPVWGPLPLGAGSLLPGRPRAGGDPRECRLPNQQRLCPI